MSVTARIGRLTGAVARRVEEAAVLDAPADAVDKVMPVLQRPGPVSDSLSGTAAGHPVHPALVGIPVGTFTGAIVLDLVGQSRAARTMVGLGLLSSVPTVVTGLSDWSYTQGAERRVGMAHMALNAAGLAVIAGSWLARGPQQRHRFGLGPLLHLTGFGIVGASAWLGGHLAYALGVGVDTTAFLPLDADWVDLLAEHDVPVDGFTVGDLDGVGVLLTRYRGRIVAMANRCTHRGGPLADGPLVDGCVECPWHGSRFDLLDGSVVLGPATEPAPTFATRVVDGRVLVHRSEVRSLRTNPTR